MWARKQDGLSLSCIHFLFVIAIQNLHYLILSYLDWVHINFGKKWVLQTTERILDTKSDWHIYWNKMNHTSSTHSLASNSCHMDPQWEKVGMGTWCLPDIPLLSDIGQSDQYLFLPHRDWCHVQVMIWILWTSEQEPVKDNFPWKQLGYMAYKHVGR